MNLIVSSIAEGVSEQNTIVNKCIIASNDKVGNNANIPNCVYMLVKMLIDSNLYFSEIHYLSSM